MDSITDSTTPIDLNVQLRPMPTSPYIVGRPIPSAHFINRQTQVDHFFSIIGAPQIQCLSILGLWGSGKTSFLNCVRHRPVMARYLSNPDDYLLVFVNLRQIYQQTDFYHKVIDGLAKAAGLTSLLPQLDHSQCQGLRVLLNLVAPRRVAILLDGFDQLFPPVACFEDTFFTDLRSLVESYQLAWVATSQRSLFELFLQLGLNPHNSPFCNIFGSTIYLGALPDKEANELIIMPARIAKQPFDASDVQWLKEVAGGLPAFLQRAAQALFYARNYYPSKAAFRSAHREFIQWAGYQFTHYWKNFTVEEKDVLVRMVSKSSSNWSVYTHKHGYGALYALTAYGLVTETDADYYINGTALADWIRQQSSIKSISKQAYLSSTRSSVPGQPTISSFEDGYALIIGISNYSNVHIPALPNTIIKDAQDVAMLLRSPERCGYLDAHIQLLLNEQATANGIRDGLRWLARSAGIGDTALVFFSGHGGRVNNNPQADNYLIPYDCDPVDLLRTAISSEELTSLLHNIKSQRLVVLFDSCYSGGTGDPKTFERKLIDFKLGLGENYYEQLAQGVGRVILASSRSDEVSLVLTGMDNSLFTYYLLEALQGRAHTRGDGLIRIFDVFDYVSEAVPARGLQHPIFKAHDLENNFPIARYLGGKHIESNYDEIRAQHTTVDKRNLREEMVQAFNVEELETLCADVQQELADNKIKLAVNLEGVGGSGMEAKVLNLINYLDRRDYLAFLVKAVRRARPGII